LTDGDGREEEKKIERERERERESRESAGGEEDISNLPFRVPPFFVRQIIHLSIFSKASRRSQKTLMPVVDPP